MNDFKSEFNIKQKSRLLCSDSFLSAIKKHKNILESFLKNIKQNLLSCGQSFLTNKKNQKLLSGNFSKNIFEFRSKIKGHRILFMFGYQLLNPNLKDNDIVLCDYVVDHDEISKNAKKLSNSGKQNVKLLFDDLTIEQTNKKIDEQNFNKLYYLPVSLDYFIPFLSDKQNEIINNNSKYVLVEGVAGSGKTNICIGKILNSVVNNKKVLYSTFSNSLLQRTEEIVKTNYVLQLTEIKKYLQNGEEKKAEQSLASFGLNNIVLDENQFNNLLNNLNKVEYKLVENITNNNKKVVDILDFFNIFDMLLNDDSCIQYCSYAKRQKLKSLDVPLEILFNDIEGVLLGIYKEDSNIITLEEYKQKRNQELSLNQLNLIYDFATSYLNFVENSNKYMDKNLLATQILNNKNLNEFYDVLIVDEVQDFTQRQLVMFKQISKSVFLAGDPSQMINPAYFSFAKLKDIFKDKSFKYYLLELNYRNTTTLNNMVNNYNEIIKTNLGYHSNITKISKSVGSNESTYLFFANNKEILSKILNTNYDDYVIVVSSQKEKQILKNKLLNKIQVLTISDIKGLEEGTVILFNIFSNNKKIFDSNLNINKKVADENSILRYYFNLFYVGITRAQRNLLVVEEDNIKIFSDFIKNNFTYFDEKTNVETLVEKLNLKQLSDEERIEKIDKALKEFKYEIAQHNIMWLKNKTLKEVQTFRYNVYKTEVEQKDYNLAIQKFVSKNLYNDAIRYLNIVGDFKQAKFLQDYVNNLNNVEDAYYVYFCSSFKQMQMLAKSIIDKNKQKIKTDTTMIKSIIEEEL